MHLVIWNFISGFHAFRNSTKGSPFISAVTKVFREHGDQLEITQLLTHVNHDVAYNFQSSGSQSIPPYMKQAPSFESMLTKELYFHRKP